MYFSIEQLICNIRTTVLFGQKNVQLYYLDKKCVTHLQFLVQLSCSEYNYTTVQLFYNFTNVQMYVCSNVQRND